VVATLAKVGRHAKRSPRRVTLAGDNMPLSFHHEGTGLHVRVPDAALHPFGVAFRIDGVLQR
jgi:alpha-L-fucosidase